MKTNEFNKIFQYAKGVNVVNDDMLNCAGWFWINLTEIQHKKMYKLLLLQGAQEITNAKGKKQILLSNGLGIIKL
jgi:hypothetical protein